MPVALRPPRPDPQTQARVDAAVKESTQDRQWYRITNSADDEKAAESTADVWIFDYIGWWGVEARWLVDDINGLDVDRLIVHINSPGGDVFDGVAIYNGLLAHKAKVTVIVEGLAASAASFIAMAGDEIVMRQGSQMMIHDAWGYCVGPASDMQKMADTLARTSDQIAGIYATRSGTPTDMWREAMRAESWFAPQEAVDAGLADRVDGNTDTDTDTDEELSDSHDMTIFNYAGRSHAPDPLLASGATGQPAKPPSRGSKMKFLDKIAALAGVDDPSEDAVLAALEKALNQDESDDDDDTVQVPKDKFDELATAVGKTGDDDPVEVIDEAIAQLADEDSSSNSGDTVIVDAGRFDELLAAETEAKTVRSERARQDAEKKVDAAIADDRLTAASRDRWINKLLEDPEDAEERLAHLATYRVPRSETGHSSPIEDSHSNSTSHKPGYFPAVKV